MVFRPRSKFKSPFAVHAVKYQKNPFAMSHGSNEFHFPKHVTTKQIKISKPRLYKSEISSDEIGGK